ncbi:MAG: T9SS type A sorting domain-containing protein [Bacteroidetes bacterium]|nr:T9SS type A sorting domain-containing protein [Bacteroidota bacterium]
MQILHLAPFISKQLARTKRELFNSIGQLLFTTKENEIDVSKYSKGVYYLKVASKFKKIIIE